jgi:hypothetical protein
MSGINKTSPYSNQHLPPMLVSRADARPGDGEHRRETSCEVATLCESYCLKDGSQQPRQPRRVSQKEWRRAWLGTFRKVAALAEPPALGSQASWQLQRGVKLVDPANSDSGVPQEHLQAHSPHGQRDLKFKPTRGACRPPAPPDCAIAPPPKIYFAVSEIGECGPAATARGHAATSRVKAIRRSVCTAPPAPSTRVRASSPNKSIFQDI